MNWAVRWREIAEGRLTLALALGCFDGVVDWADLRDEAAGVEGDVGLRLGLGLRNRGTPTLLPARKIAR